MSGMTGRQSSLEVAQEAESARANLTHTLDQLRENLKPKNIVEDVVDTARIGATSMAEGVFGLARAHPWPALLVGAGWAMVMSLGSAATSRRKALIDHGPAVDDISSIVVASGDGQDAAWAPYRKAPLRPIADLEPAGSIRPQATGQGAMRSPSNPLGLLAGPSVGTKPSIEQPLIIAALGLAVGAIVGAALPGTRTENEWLGPTSSSMKQAAQDAARGELDELKAVAGRARDNLATAGEGAGTGRGTGWSSGQDI